MKYLKQFGIILVISFVGEILNYLIPLPIPAGIYGIIILFFALMFKIVPLEQVKDTAHFLIEIMPIMFISPAVGVMETFGLIKTNWVSYILIIAISTVLVMAVSGGITQLIIRYRRKREVEK
jgi:holin-like protein